MLYSFFFFFQCYSSILFRREQEKPRLEKKGVEKCVGREKEREKETESVFMKNDFQIDLINNMN